MYFLPWYLKKKKEPTRVWGGPHYTNGSKLQSAISALDCGLFTGSTVLPPELQRSHLCAAAVQHSRNWNQTSTTALTVTSEVGSLLQSKAQCGGHGDKVVPTH